MTLLEKVKQQARRDCMICDATNCSHCIIEFVVNGKRVNYKPMENTIITEA